MQAPTTADQRPTTLVDLMILVVSMAVWLALSTPAFDLIASVAHSTSGGAVQLGRYLNIIVLNFLMAMIPTWMILRLRRPRPALRVLVNQPGFAACASVLALVAVALPLYIAFYAGPAGPAVAVGCQAGFSLVVPAAWLFLLATRRWAPEPTWIDRLGRLIGVVFMVSFPAHIVLLRLPA